MDQLVNPAQLRRLITEEEFDYQTLLDALKEYKDPQRRRQDLLKKQVVLRVKKGLYVWHPDYGQGPFSKEILANLIFGPSYISLQYALAYWGLIPESAETVTSVTPKKAKNFSTPVGLFTYQHLHSRTYPLGVNQVEVRKQRFALMASPEKAWLDFLALNVNDPGCSFEELIFEDMRIARQDWMNLSVPSLLAYGENYRSKTIHAFCRYLRRRI